MAITLTKVLLKLSFHITKSQKTRGWHVKAPCMRTTRILSTAEGYRRKALVRQSNECTFFGKVAVNFFTCDRHQLCGVTLQIAFRRSIDDFVIMTDDAAKHYKMKIFEANLYMRKITLNDEVVSSIEKTLLTSPASYHYLEYLAKTFWLLLVFTIENKKTFLQ